MSDLAPVVTWRLVWEADAPPKLHRKLAALLAAAFPDVATIFSGARSWFSARPEARLIGFTESGPVAHLGFVRRTLRIESQSDGEDGAVLAADVGLVAVHPDLQAAGVGAAMLAELARVLHGLALPFGFLTTADDRVGFYERSGWRRTPTQSTRMIGPTDAIEVWAQPSLFLPVTALASEWPTGQIVRDGYEV